MSIRPVAPSDHPACEAILRSLRDWFGIPEAIDAYVGAIRTMQTIVAVDDRDRVLGFLSLDPHNATTIEIHVMAVAAASHRSGIGRALVDRAARIAMASGHRLLEAKTLGPSHPDPNYAATRRFYDSMGFLPVEEIEGLWPGNPCLIMVKVLDNLESDERAYEHDTSDRESPASG